MGWFASIALCAGLSTLMAAAPPAPQTDQLVRSTLAEVEGIAQKAPSLNALGKATLTQSATLLDLGESALPALLVASVDPGKDWKVRYWVVDMLGYVGNAGTAAHLIGILNNGKEDLSIRLRAVEALLGIEDRGGLKPEEFRLELRKSLRRTKSAQLQRRLRQAIKEQSRLIQKKG